MGSKMELINNFVKAYRTLAEFPTINSAQVLTKHHIPDLINVTSVWSQRNIELGEIIKFKKNFLIKTSSSEVIFESTPISVSSQELFKFSTSEKYHCIIRKTKVDNKKKQFIEIWTQNGLFRNFDASAFDIHGEIYTDGEFGTLEWSPDEEKVLYVAEKKLKKSEPFYKQKSLESSEHLEEKSPIIGDEYIYKPDWGEQLVEKHQPVVGICDVKSEKLTVLEGIPSNFSPGQLIWSKDGSQIFGIVLENEPRRLGLVYCTNRLSYVFQINLKGEFKILSEGNKSVRSPRLSLDGKSLFWLQKPFGGGHNGCQELVKLDLATNKREVLIDIVRSVGKTFSGLFLHGLPRRCFSKDGTKLFFSSCNKMWNCSYYLDLETKKKVKPFEVIQARWNVEAPFLIKFILLAATKEVHILETGEGSATILDVHDDTILISAASLRQPPVLKVSKSIGKLEWIPITKSEIICRNSVLKEMEFESKTGNHKLTYYNALYYGPPAPSASGQKVPLIVYPHGGPHSASVNDYSFDANFLVSIGYGILMVNYRGSTGTGQDGVEFLLGKIGDTDVKDNHEAVTQILKDIPYLDKKNVFLNGRSHGGYLVGQLSAQYPDFYRAVVSGNPVTDVPSMFVMSDIPDWATSESGLSFDESKPLTIEQINKMIAVSPTLLSDKIKAPTLFLIGKKDLRVPPYNGIRMYNALKARKVKVRLNLYDDNHTLGNIPNHIDCLINTAIWFSENKA